MTENTTSQAGEGSSSRVHVAQVLEHEATPIAVEADQEAIDEVDSVFGDADDSSAYSASIASSIYNHVYENGRRYHSFREGAYLSPDDEDEQDRLDLQHHIWKSVLRGALYTAPIKDPMEILDIGTGTGIWAIDIAEEFPAATVTGTDISPIQPEWVPPNCHFYIDDLESPWVFKKQYDYIHARVLSGCVSDWDHFHREMIRHLKPGGWFELQDYDSYFFCDDETMKSDSWLNSWIGEMNKGADKFGKVFNHIGEEKADLKRHGMINVTEHRVNIPVGVWAKDKKLKEVGKIMEVMLLKTVDSMTPAMYTRVLGYGIEETRIQMELIKKEIANKRIHKYVRYYFVSGQKPETDTV